MLILLLGIILATSILIIWFVPFVVRKVSKNTHTIRPLGLVCFLVMTAIVVGIGYACIFGGESLSNIFNKPGKAVGILLFLWIGSWFGVVTKTSKGKLAQIHTFYNRFLKENDIDILMELCAEFSDEESISSLKQHPAEGKIIMESAQRVLAWLESHPQEAPVSPGAYYATARFYEEGIDGNADLPRAIEMYTKSLAVPCPNPDDREEFEEYYTLAKKRINELTNK